MATAGPQASQVLKAAIATTGITSAHLAYAFIFWVGALGAQTVLAQAFCHQGVVQDSPDHFVQGSQQPVAAGGGPVVIEAGAQGLINLADQLKGSVVGRFLD
jgi:hypothetical protein